MNKVEHCNHCAGTIVTSLGEYCVGQGLIFCSEDCKDGFFYPDNPEPYPLDYDAGY